ncbi:hypothetical protein DW099_03520 [Emergencia timonensis]|uniref:Uncharacterized protein n=1 Tax=Emergencia timonensis TaxID=1776384 RepID=A0A415E784_9FIRM|nr:hypothetical protein DW099_03520 [Emergencia timonensis]
MELCFKKDSALKKFLKKREICPNQEQNWTNRAFFYFFDSRVPGRGTSALIEDKLYQRDKMLIY